ncbi:MAG: hypothetical protein ACOY3K_01970 [Candidatus Omnitrophota bacterium]
MLPEEKKRFVFALVKDMVFAGKLAEQAALHHLTLRNFDRPERLVEQTKGERPSLVLVDLDRAEAEAFRLLKTLRADADLKGIPVIGCVSQAKRDLKAEAEFAGCLRVYFKTEFFKTISDIMIRYAQ